MGLSDGGSSGCEEGEVGREGQYLTGKAISRDTQRRLFNGVGTDAATPVAGATAASMAVAVAAVPPLPPPAVAAAAVQVSRAGQVAGGGSVQQLLHHLEATTCEAEVVDLT